MPDLEIGNSHRAQACLNPPVTIFDRESMTSRISEKLICFQILFLFGYPVLVFFSISLSQLAAFFGACIWLVVWKTRDVETRPRWPLWKLFLAFSLAAVLATVTGVCPEKSVSYLRKLLEPLLFFWVLNGLHTVNLKECLAEIFARTKSTSCQRSFQFLSRYAVIPPVVWFATLLVLVSAGVAGLALFQGISWEWTGRPYGTYSNTVTLSVVLLVVGLLNAGMWIYRLRSAWLLVCLVLQSMAIMGTLTRGAWLGFSAGLLVLILARFPKWLWMFPVAFLTVYLAAPELIQTRVETLFTLEDPAITSRLGLWKAGFDIWKDFPLTGGGFNSLACLDMEYTQHARYLARYGHLHNIYLQMAVDAGLIGLLSWGSIWLGYLVLLWHQRTRENLSSLDLGLNLGATAAVTGFLVACLFENHFYDQEVIMVLYAIMALPLVSYFPKPESTIMKREV